MSWFSSRDVSAKMLRASSSTTSTLRPRRTSFEPCSRSSMACFSGGRSVTTRWRNSEVSSSSRSGDRTSLSTMLLAIVLSCVCSAAVRSLPVKTTTGTSASVGSAVHLLQQLEAGHVGQAQVEHDAIERPLEQGLQRLAAGRRRSSFRCRRAPSSSTMEPRSISLSSTTSSRLVRGAVNSLIRSNAVSSPSVVGALTR